MRVSVYNFIEMLEASNGHGASDRSPLVASDGKPQSELV